MVYLDQADDCDDLSVIPRTYQARYPLKLFGFPMESGRRMI